MTEGPNERSGKYDMDLRSDKQRNIQLELDFSSAPAGEAREAGREEKRLNRVWRPMTPKAQPIRVD